MPRRRKKKPKPQREIIYLLPVAFALLILFSAFASASISGSFYTPNKHLSGPSGKASPFTVPTTPEPLCEDFDGGDIFKDGTCKDSYGRSYDYCMDSERVAEMECSPAVCKEKIYNCLDYNSTGCKLGVCVDPQCQDGDNGYVPTKKAKCTDIYGINEDYCKNNDILMEYTCAPGSTPKCGESEVSCSGFGFDSCVNGECVTNKTGLPDLFTLTYGIFLGQSNGSKKWFTDIKIGVANSGFGAAGPSTAKFVISPLTNESSPQKTIYVYTPGLLPLQIEEIGVKLEVLPGKYNFKATLDYLDEINESNENNNIFSKDFP
jgi:hypothetical protein